MAKNDKKFIRFLFLHYFRVFQKFIFTKQHNCNSNKLNASFQQFFLRCKKLHVRV